MSERWVRYKSNGGTVRIYKVVGSYVDRIMYGPQRDRRVSCLRLEKPWAPGETFGVVASRCEDVPAPGQRPLRQHEDLPREQVEAGPTYSHLGGYGGSEECDGEDAGYAMSECGPPF